MDAHDGYQNKLVAVRAQEVMGDALGGTILS
jgi:hypothetical protein